MDTNNPSIPLNQPVPAALNSLHSALDLILNPNSYINADFNDASVSAAFAFCSKYMNDQDFRNSLLYLPKSTLPTMSFTDPYLYNWPAPYMFNLFPPFLNLPIDKLSPNLIINGNNPEIFLKYQSLGASILRYAVESILLKNNQPLSEYNITLPSFLNEHSLNILCQAYNLEFNYKFIGLQIPSYKLFLAFFGIYHETYLANPSQSSNEHWNLLFDWLENLLGYSNINKSPIEKAEPKIHEPLPSQKQPILKEKDTNHHSVETVQTGSGPIPDDINLQELIQSVQQDINQSKIATIDLTYKIDEYPDLKTGYFSCHLLIDKVEFSYSKAMNKKLAKSGCALIAAIDPSFIKYIRRSYNEHWNKKYLNNKSIIKQKLILDPRFIVNDINETNFSFDQNMNDNDINNIINNNSGSPISNIGSPIPSSINNNIITSPINSSISNTPIRKPMIQLSTAKEKVYAYYNSKYNIVPKYTFKQLGNGKFEAKLTLGDKITSIGIGPSKKDAGAIAAMKVIEDNLDINQ